MAEDDDSYDSPLHRKVALAIYDSQVKMARQAAADYEINFERLRKVLDTAFAESDRAAAILIFALAEDLMIECLKRRLNPHVAGGWDSITDGNGVLATANDRITMLHLLYWVRDTTSGDMRLLKAIRNRFAHHADVDSFDDKKIVGWISSMSQREKPALALWNKEERSRWRRSTQRELYLMRASCALTQLVHDLAVGPAARSAQVNPRDVEGEGFEDAPENLRELRRVAAAAILRCVPPDSSGVPSDRGNTAG